MPTPPIAVSPNARAFRTPAGNLVQVAPRDTWEAYVKSARDTALLLQQFEPVWPHITEVEFDLLEYQTAIRDQDGAGNCWAFGGIAALEAAYKRAHGLELDLSEQYLTQVNRAGELYDDYVSNPATPHENNSTEWANQGSSDICWKLVRAAMPEEHLAPQLTQSQIDALAQRLAGGTITWGSTQEQLDALEWSPELIPTEARWACRYRATGAVTVSDLSTDSLEQIIAAEHEIVVDISLDWTQDAATGIYHYDNGSGGGGHVLLLVGYNKTEQYFLAKNSWGGTEYYKLGYDFVRHCLGGAAYITGVVDPNTSPQLAAQWLGRWHMDHDGWQGDLVIRRFTNFRRPDPGVPTKLGNYYPADGSERRDVNGHFTEDGRGMVFWVADQPGRVEPGTETGQRFEAYVFSWDPSLAAGRTSWSGSDYGVRLSRSPLTVDYSSGTTVEDWLGHWAMDHDGWRGTLSLDSVIPLPFPVGITEVTGSYTGADGQTVGVSGIVFGDAHVLELDVALPGGGQHFSLLMHTWEKDVFSGTTVWSGITFGVVGSKEKALAARLRQQAVSVIRDTVTAKVLAGR